MSVAAWLGVALGGLCAAFLGRVLFTAAREDLHMRRIRREQFKAWRR